MIRGPGVFAKMSNEQPTSESVADDEFIRLFTTAQRPLFLHILPMVGNASDADEVLQETNLIMWAKKDQFQVGTSFLAWGRAIARLEVFRFRRSRPSKLRFLEGELLDLVVARVEQSSDELELRQEALANCMAQLRSKDRQLIQLRYTPGISGEDLAVKLGRPANSIYQSLGRIRRLLAECVRRRLALGGVT